MTWMPNAGRPGPGSGLRRLLDRWAPAAGSFVCGVRVLSGDVPGEGARWTFRNSAIDPLVVDGVVCLQHGRRSLLRLRLASQDLAPGRRPHHATISATEVGTGADVEISLPAGELINFGIEGL